MSKEYFNQIAAKWDGLSTGRERPILNEIVAFSALRAGDHVLDVGCGTGVLIPALLSAVGEEGTVVGVDFAEAMLDRARAKGFSGNVTFVQADVLALPFPDRSFNAVFCNNAIPHFADIAGALREMMRVLKPGGQLIVCHTNSREAVNNIHREIGGAVGNHLIPTVAEMKQLLLEAGYADPFVLDGPDRFIAGGASPLPL